MTKFQIMSDLHQEFYGDKPILKKEDVVGECLLLAGDITAGPVSIEYMNDFGIPGYRILGNHEFYRRHWIDCIPEHRAMSEGKPVKLLEDETVIHNGVRIIAATLWTDFNAPVNQKPIFDVTGNNLAKNYIEHQGFYCRQMMSDFTAIKMISISAWEERHKKSLEYIKSILSQKHDGPTIVMTHHAPSFKSSHPKYSDSAITGGFCSALDYLIEGYEPQLWIHGHCHESFDYFIGKTRVVCNPRGYYSENKDGFKPQLIVEL